MSEQIVGYEGGDIVRAQQQRGARLQHSDLRLGRTDHSVTDADPQLLARHGSIEALEAVEFHGTADRLRRADQLSVDQLSDNQSDTKS